MGSIQQSKEAMGSLPVESLNPLDPETFCDEAKSVVDFLAGYYRDVHRYPVLSPVQPDYLSRHTPNAAPYLPEPLDTILADVQSHIVPGLTHWQSPAFFGYFPASASTAGFVGEMLCSGFNVVGFNWAASPAATELENVVMDWMAKLLDLPAFFLFESNEGGGGVLYSTTCEAVLCTMVAARDKALKRLGGDANIAKLVVYASDQTHSTVKKAAKIVGIPPANFRAIPTTAASGYAFSPKRLASAMEEDLARGLVPMYVCGTVGSTVVNAVDPLAELGAVCGLFGAWFHVDAAYGGNAAICPEFRRYLDGVETADSVSLNAHKWFLTNSESCCLWVRRSSELTEALTENPEYLRNGASDGEEVVDYKDWQLAVSRRFRALKLWVVLRRYGAARLREHIRSDVRMAARLEEMVEADGRFEVAVRRRFALVCFRLKATSEEEEEKMNRALLEKINGSGKLFITHGKVEGRIVLRMAVGSTLTEQSHVDAAWELVTEKASELLRLR